MLCGVYNNMCTRNTFRYYRIGAADENSRSIEMEFTNCVRACFVFIFRFTVFRLTNGNAKQLVIELFEVVFGEDCFMHRND